ncbi:MAG: anion permease [bacterium]|nr:anion permease [bacterium]
MGDPALLALVVAATLGFAFTNGFHDASNSVATAVTTRALTPRAAVLLAAVMNAVGALLSTSLARVVGFGLADPPEGRTGLLLVLAGVCAAIVWNLLTWWRGMPSSSSHALIAGLAGAALLTPGVLDGGSLLALVVLPMLLSPVLGFALGIGGMRAVGRIFSGRDYRRSIRGFRYAQTISGAALALGHGLQDAQKSMGIIMLALVLGGAPSEEVTPWVVVSCAVALALGTLAGGWRVTRTLAWRITRINPPAAFVTETASALILGVAALALRVPVSTTHTVASVVVGTGVNRGVKQVQWNTVVRMLLVWVATPLGAGGIALVLRLALMPFG